MLDVYYAAKTARAHTHTCRSPLFGSDAFGFQVVLNLQPARAGRSVEISLLLLPRPQTLQTTLQSASSVFFSLTIKNQKDDDLSITMDEEREIDGDSHGDLSELGFQHFMTFDLLMDTSAGYLSSEGVMISTCVRIVMTPPTNTLTSACSSLSPSITSSVGCAAQGGGRVVVRVACEDDLHRHVGAGLIDFAAAHEFVVHAHTPMSDFREVMAGDLGFAASACCIHPCLFVHMRHLRLLPPISDVQLTQSIADLVRPLGSEEWNLLVLPRFGRGGGGGAVDGDEDLLLFLKFYDPSSQSLEYIGNLLVKPTTMLSAMGPLVNQRIGLAPREALSGYQELCGGAAGGVEGAGGAGGVFLRPLQPSQFGALADRGELSGDIGHEHAVSSDVSVREFGLAYGSVLYFQKRLCNANTRLQQVLSLLALLVQKYKY